MPELKRAYSVLRQGAGPDDAVVALDYDQRLLRRKRLSTSGADVLVDLPEATSLDDGDALVLEGGGQVAVQAAPEPLIEVRAENLPRIAWHIGNRHAPCEILPDALRLRRDKVLARMLEQLGAEVREISAPFRPEGGAYGHGRTFGHDHAHFHGDETGHVDGHDHAHTHDHTHTHTHQHTHTHGAGDGQ